MSNKTTYVGFIEGHYDNGRPYLRDYTRFTTEQEASNAMMNWDVGINESAYTARYCLANGCMDGILEDMIEIHPNFFKKFSKSFKETFCPWLLKNEGVEGYNPYRS